MAVIAVDYSGVSGTNNSVINILPGCDDTHTLTWKELFNAVQTAESSGVLKGTDGSLKTMSSLSPVTKAATETKRIREPLIYFQNDTMKP